MSLVVTFSSQTSSWLPLYKAMFSHLSVSLVQNAHKCDIVLVTYWDVAFSKRFPQARIVFISGEPKPLPRGFHPHLVLDCKSNHSKNYFYFPFYASSFFERHQNNPNHLLKTTIIDGGGDVTRKSTDSIITTDAANHMIDNNSTPNMTTILSPTSNSKTKFCAYMYRYDIAHRVALFDALNKYKSVDALGKSRNKNRRHAFQGTNPYDAAVSIYKPYKFVICCENHVIPGYITEKIINAMLAGAIPIYYGAPDITQHFNSKSFIRVQDFPNISAMVSFVQKVDNDSVLYQQMLQQPWFDNNQLNKYLDIHLQAKLAGDFVIGQFRSLLSKLSLPLSSPLPLLSSPPLLPTLPPISKTLQLSPTNRFTLRPFLTTKMKSKTNFLTIRQQSSVQQSPVPQQFPVPQQSPVPQQFPVPHTSPHIVPKNRKHRSAHIRNAGAIRGLRTFSQGMRSRLSPPGVRSRLIRPDMVLASNLHQRTSFARRTSMKRRSHNRMDIRLRRRRSN